MKDLTQRSSRIALALGHDWLGEEHLLLAMIHADDQTPAGVALRRCNLTYAACGEYLEQLLSTYGERMAIPPSIDGLIMSAGALRVHFRAEGLAVGFGHEGVTATHVLLSMLWEHNQSTVITTLDHFGVPRERILAELVALNVAVPTVPLPSRPQWSDFRQVSRHEFEELVPQLRRAGILYRFNYSGDAVMLSTSEPQTVST